MFKKELEYKFDEFAVNLKVDEGMVRSAIDEIIWDMPEDIVRNASYWIFGNEFKELPLDEVRKKIEYDSDIEKLYEEFDSEIYYVLEECAWEDIDAREYYDWAN